MFFQSHLFTIYIHTDFHNCLSGLTSVMIYHRRASLSEQHTDLPIGHCTKQDLCRTSRYAAKSSPEIARYRILMPTARAATVSVATYALTLKS